MQKEENLVYLFHSLFKKIRAIGALISYMAKQRLTGELEDPSEPLSVVTIKIISLDSFLYLDWVTSRSLQIFSNDNHPCMMKGTGRAKEGQIFFGPKKKEFTRGKKWLSAHLILICYKLHFI